MSDSDDHHESDLTTSQSGQRPLIKVGVEPLVLDGYQLFENHSKFSAAVVVPYRWVPCIRWSNSNEFACAVIVGPDGPVIIISAYLPQPGIGVDIYLRATAAVLDLAHSSPRHLQVKRLFVGADAVCTLSHHGDVSHVVGSWTMSARSCAARSQAFLDLALELRLRAANTFIPEGQDSSEPCWTHRWKKNYTVKSQIDFVLCPIGADTTAQLLYKLDCCSGHAPVHVEADMTLGRTAPIPRRARSFKGWRPVNDQSAAGYSHALNPLSEGADVSTIQHIMSLLVLEMFLSLTLHSELLDPFQRSLLRLKRLACCWPRLPRRRNDERWLARTLYRPKRKWLRPQANQRFASQAMQFGRSDRSRNGRVQWMFSLEGGKTYDVAEWSRSLQHHYSSLYKSQVEDSEQQLARLHSLESACYLDHQGGNHEWIHLPISVLPDTRHEMAAGKASGPDGVVYEMLSYLELEALATVRVAFGNRINCQEDSTSSVTDWLRTLVYNIPKCTRAHNMSKWRPLSMTCAFSKWYLSSLCHVLKEHSTAPTCDQYGFAPGCQPVQVTGMTRLILERATEWKLPVWICKGDVARAFDNLEHPLVDGTFCSRQVLGCLRAALLRELRNITLDVPGGLC